MKYVVLRLNPLKVVSVLPKIVNNVCVDSTGPNPLSADITAWNVVELGFVCVQWNVMELNPTSVVTKAVSTAGNANVAVGLYAA
jgi:hypothetical protein